MRSCSFEYSAPRGLRLFTPFRHKGFFANPVHPRKPLFCVYHEWFQQDALSHAPHTHRVSLEAELPRQPHRLAPSIPENLRDPMLRHWNILQCGLYHEYIPPAVVQSIKPMIASRGNAARYIRSSKVSSL